MERLEDGLKKAFERLEMERGAVGPVRNQVPYEMERSIHIVTQIGKHKNPKFIIDSENEFVYKNLIRWMHNDSEFKSICPESKKIINGNLKSGIYLAGSTGSGKSWALEIMSTYASFLGLGFTAGKSQFALEYTTVRTDKICREYQESGLYDFYTDRQIICFQDLADEPAESIYMGNRQNVMKRILSIRGDRHNQITLISSNLPLLDYDLEKIYGDRVISRLREMCNYFELSGRDRRL